MSVLVYDNYKEILNYLELDTQLKLSIISKFHTKTIINDLIKEYRAMKLQVSPKKINFIRACKYRYFILADYIIKYFNIEADDEEFQTATIYIRKKNIFDDIKWLLEKSNKDEQTYLYCFNDACLNNNITAADFIYEKCVEYHFGGIYLHKIFSNVCFKGHLLISKWMIEKFDLDTHILKIGFEKACINKNLILAQYLLSFVIETNIDFDMIFQSCCMTNGIDIVHWLYSLGVVDISADENRAFKKACGCGNVEIAKWIYEQPDFILDKATLNRAFVLACDGGNIVIVKWLYELGADVHVDNDYAFRLSCKEGHVTVAKWLYDIGDIDIHYHNDEALRRMNREIYSHIYSHKNNNRTARIR